MFTIITVTIIICYVLLSLILKQPFILGINSTLWLDADNILFSTFISTLKGNIGLSFFCEMVFEFFFISYGVIFGNLCFPRKLSLSSKFWNLFAWGLQSSLFFNN